MERHEFGALLKKYRLATPDPARPDQPLGYRGLARLTGIDHGTVSNVEKGYRGISPELAARLDRALGANGELVEAARAVTESNRNQPAIVPAQLPPEQHPLIGRDAEVTALLEALRAPRNRAVAPRVLTVVGPGGVGKTALAVAVAHRVSPDMDGGALMADLRGWDDEVLPRSVEDVLRLWCRALGTPSPTLGGDLEDLLGTWRSITARRRVAVVVDNARADQVDALIPASPGSIVIITSRDRTIEVTGAHWHEVKPLSVADATELLAIHARMPPEVVEPLTPYCGGLPLAVRVAGLDARHHWSKETIMTMTRLYDEQDELDAVDRTTRRSYADLSAEEQRAWRLCALATPSPTLDQAAAAISRTPEVTRSLLNRAADSCLLDAYGGRWEYHDRHRIFARSEARRVDGESTRDEAVFRGLAWILHGSARAARRLTGRDDTPVDLIDCPDDLDLPEFSTYAEALSWMDAQWQASPAPVHAALIRGWHKLAAQLVEIATNYVFVAKPLGPWDRAAHDVLTEIETEGEPEDIAWMHHARGLVALDRGHADRALHHLATGLRLRRALGHTRDIGWSAINAARAAGAAGRSDDEIAALIDEAHGAFTAIGYPAGLVLCDAGYASLASRQGDWARAADLLQAAFDRLPEVDDPAITSYIATALAEAELHLGNHQQAAETARYADHHAQHHEAPWYRIPALAVLARCAPPDEGRSLLQLAINIATNLHDPREEELRRQLDGLGADSAE